MYVAGFCVVRTCRVFRLRRDCWAKELLHFNRCACLTASELDCLDAQRPWDVQRSPIAATTTTTTTTLTSTPAGSSSGGNCEDVAHCDNGGKPARKEPDKNGKVDAAFSNGVERGTRRDRTEIDARVEDSGAFPFRALSAENELAALTEVVLKLHNAIGAFPTTIGCDEVRIYRILWSLYGTVVVASRKR